jgi:hypothetical protein
MIFGRGQGRFAQEALQAEKDRDGSRAEAS